MPRPSCGNLAGNELTRNLLRNIRPQSSPLAEPPWIDPGIKELISTSKPKKKKAQAGNEMLNILTKKSSQARKKPAAAPPPKIGLGGAALAAAAALPRQTQKHTGRTRWHSFCGCCGPRLNPGAATRTSSEGSMKVCPNSNLGQRASLVIGLCSGLVQEGEAGGRYVVVVPGEIDM